MTNGNFGNTQIDRREGAINFLEIVGGSAVIGTLVVGAVAAVGEIVDRIVAHGDSFPGGTLGKVAGGLAVSAAVLIGSKEYLDQ